MNCKQNEKRISGGWLRCAARLFVVALAVFVLCLPAFSQGNTGRILGSVFDQSGATIAGATVTVIDVDRGVNRALTTDDAGEYNAPNLTPGSYTVRAEAKGFKKLERQNVVVEVAKELRVDLTLQPGAQEQTVTVTEAVPLVDTTTATLGGTLENSEIIDLPLNGRDYQSLLGLRPGVMLQVGGGPWTQSTNGVRPDQSVWMIDGVINSNFFDARPIAGMPSPITDGATILPIDSIQEFNLMENPKAEYGWKPGAVVNVGIKSGTNALHGSAYGFYRSSNWDARNYFNVVAQNGSCLVGPLAACDKPPAQLKQYGASVGGPIRKDKLFFFGNFEGLNDLIGNAFGTTGGNGVPETGTSNGDVNQNMAAAIQALANAATPVARSAISEKLAGCSESGTYPNITATCSGGYFASNPTNGIGFLSTAPNINNSYNGVGKIDYHVNEKNSVNGDFIIGRYHGDGEDRGFVNKIFNNGYTINTWTASGNWDYTPNSAIVNEVRFGYNRMTFDTTSDDAGLGVSSIVNTGSTLPGLPTISIGNPASPSGTAFGLFGTWHNRPQAISPNPYWDAIDDFSYLVGKHSLKFGGEFAHIEADSNIPDYGRGRVNFSSLQNFFAGVPKGGQFFIGNATRRMLWTSAAGFAQDDWRIAPKFTLNVGLRYEYKSPIREANNLWANFDPSSPTGLVQQGSPGHSRMWNPDRGDFSPRIGFAYDLNGKGTTVVRGGFSVIYETFTAVEWMNQNQFQNDSAVSLAANPTGACNVTVPVGQTCAQAGGSTFGGSIVVKAAKFKANQLGPWDGPGTIFPVNAVLSCTSGSPCDLMAVDPNLKTPYVMNFSLGVTHAFSNNLSLEVGYVGNHGARLTGFANINQCPANPTVGGVNTCIGPYDSKFPAFGNINEMTNSVRSNYNSVQATLTKRMSHGVSFVAGYTFAHGLDNGSLNRFALLPQNDANPGAEYGDSDFDVRHRLTLTGTYNIPGKKGFGQLLEGWQINAIATIQSAQPWTINDYNAGPYVNFPLGFSGTDRFDGGGGHGTDRWDFFGNPSDFKGTQNSIPYCTSNTVDAAGNVTINPFAAGTAVCTSTAGVTGIVTHPANSAALIGNCLKFAPDPVTLTNGGCFANGNSVMTPPANGTFGNMGRNIFRDSGFRNLDFSVFKNFTWKERYTAQFRAEIFNILNHPIPENPYGASNGSSGGNNDPSSASSFGGAIGTPDVVAGNPLVGSGDARAIQIGLKLTF